MTDRNQTEARAPKRHVVKSHPDSFAAVLRGDKKHEVRRADRDYKVGDRLLISEWLQQSQEFTGFTYEAMISFITPPGVWGLPSDICVLSIIPSQE